MIINVLVRIMYALFFGGMVAYDVPVLPRGMSDSRRTH